jgi:hypothetical protein
MWDERNIVPENFAQESMQVMIDLLSPFVIR